MTFRTDLATIQFNAGFLAGAYGENQPNTEAVLNYMPIKEKNPASLLGPVLLIVLNLFILGPFTIFLGNIDEFPVAFTQLIVFLILAAGILFLLLSGIGLILRNNERYIAVLLSIGISLWFQGNMFVWKYGLLDGQGIDWHYGTWRGWVDGAVWLSFILIAVIFYKQVFKISKFLSFLLLTFQLLFMGIQGIQKPQVWQGDENSQQALPPPGIFDLSSKQNVFLIILDGLQSDIFEEIIQQNPEYYSILDGFIFFKDASGAFPTTKMSIPAILTGKFYDNRKPMSRFINTVMSRKTINRILLKKGFEVDMICGVMYRGGGRHTFSRHYSIARPYGVTKTAFVFSHTTLLFDLTLFRHAPHFLKRAIYNNQAWLTQRMVNKEEMSSFHFLASRAFLNDFIKNMSLTTEKPVYKFIHLMHPHPPIVVDENCRFNGTVLPSTRDNLRIQARCGLDHVVQFLNQLKAMQVYDSSFIIIQADHGAGAPVRFVNKDIQPEDLTKEDIPGLSTVVGSAAPLMLIKTPLSHGSMTISTAQVSVTDIPATVSNVLNLETTFPGQSVFDIKPGEKRKRTFYYHSWKHQNWKKEYFDALEEYIIEGDLFDLKSWKRGRILKPAITRQSVHPEEPAENGEQ